MLLLTRQLASKNRAAGQPASHQSSAAGEHIPTMFSAEFLTVLLTNVLTF